MSEKKIHLAIIPDGNRRWAKTKGWHPWKGHEYAIENFQALTEWCRRDPRISVLTVWCFSTENWKRDPKEVSELMRIYEGYLRKEAKGFHGRHTRFCHSGRLDRIPASLATLIRDVEEDTKNETGFTLHLAVDHGGKDEIIRAIQKLDDPKHVTEETLRAVFDQPNLPDVDIVIRTSGEYRTSNFMMWQSAYAEWIFLPKLFPELTPKDLEESIEEFERRMRRFGS
ncbi:di-trans,poly-cis-decaprenylcistransferase [Candidatus Peregrinibacteria bacterium]|nr:di-trans,poly-cis-decaprenylcistransferase [Candidatus Peregrinibacteria bacterium]